MSYIAYVAACTLEMVDDSNTAVVAYLDAKDQKDIKRTELEHRNCISVYRASLLYTSTKLSFKLFNDGALLRYCGVEHFPTVMNAISDFVIHCWIMVYTAATDPKKFKNLLEVLMARLRSVIDNIQLAADTMYNSLLEFISDLTQKCKTYAGINSFFVSIATFIRTNWWMLAENVSAFILGTMRIHFYKYGFQIMAVIIDLNERLSAMTAAFYDPNSGQIGEFLLVQNTIYLFLKVFVYQ